MFHHYDQRYCHHFDLRLNVFRTSWPNGPQLVLSSAYYDSPQLILNVEVGTNRLLFSHCPLLKLSKCYNGKLDHLHHNYGVSCHDHSGQRNLNLFDD